MTDQPNPNPYASPTATTGVPLPGERPFSTDFPAEMRKVRTGLSLVYFGICGVLLTAIGFPFLFALGGVSGGGGPAIMALLGGVVLVLMFVFAVVMFVGEVMCTFIPQESGAKGLAMAAVVLQIINWMATLGGALVLGTNIGSAAGSVAGLASIICFVLFLRKTSLYIGREDIARRAMRALVVGLVSIAMVAPIVVSGVMVPGPGAPAPSIALTMIAGLGGLGMLVAFLMYANTVTYLRKAIRL